jgi:hypothetical protein
MAPVTWTLETLAEYLTAVIRGNDDRYEQRFRGQEKAIELGFSAQKSAVEAALAAADRAVQKAEVAAEKRFESVNEFRNTLADQQRNLIPRAEFDVTVKALRDKVDALQGQMERQMSERAGIKGGWGYAVGAVGLVLTILTIVGLVMRGTGP